MNKKKIVILIIVFLIPIIIVYYSINHFKIIDSTEESFTLNNTQELVVEYEMKVNKNKPMRRARFQYDYVLETTMSIDGMKKKYESNISSDESFVLDNLYANFLYENNDFIVYGIGSNYSSSYETRNRIITFLTILKKDSQEIFDQDFSEETSIELKKNALDYGENDLNEIAKNFKYY